MSNLADVDNSVLREMLFRALTAPFGIVLRSSQPGALVLRARRLVERSGEEALTRLSIRISPMMSTEVWVSHPGSEGTLGA